MCRQVMDLDCPSHVVTKNVLQHVCCRNTAVSPALAKITNDDDLRIRIAGRMNSLFKQPHVLI